MLRIKFSGDRQFSASKSPTSCSCNTTIISDTEIEKIRNIKQKKGENILMFGSPSVIQTLIKYNMLDEFLLFVNPILLGNGIPLFNGIENRINLKILASKVFNSGVIGFHY